MLLQKMAEHADTHEGENTHEVGLEITKGAHEEEDHVKFICFLTSVCSLAHIVGIL